MASPLHTEHQAFEQLSRHRHAQGYVALVLEGGYVEAGAAGRLRVQAGQAVFHAAHEAHQNQFGARGARVLNLPLPTGLCEDWTLGELGDADAVVRLAERDPAEAAALLRQDFRPGGTRLNDWPDLLAAALWADTALDLGAWAEGMGLAPASLSRGFRRAYGTSPKRYRLEQRALQALRRLPHWPGTLAALAAETGFADQAHLGRSLQALTGHAPGQLRQPG